MTTTLAVTAARVRMARLLKDGGTLEPIAFVAYGSDGRVASPEDTALGSEITRLAPDQVTVTGPQVRVVSTFTAANAPTGTVLRELGILDAQGNLLTRLVLDAGRTVDGVFRLTTEVVLEF